MSDRLIDYFNGDELASTVWKSKYAADSEETPDDMHIRMASEFARIESKFHEPVDKSNLSEYGQYREALDYDKIYQLFENFKFVVPQGSVMSTLGTDVIASLSNCFVIPEPLDSYGSIMQTDQELAQLYKRRGGVGTGISNLRPAGSPTTNTAKTSTGAVSFMERFSNTTREVAMNGRRGALMLTIDVRHPDLEQFIDIKKDLTKVTGANISIKVRDEFMNAVVSDSDYVLRWPIDRSVDDIDIDSIDYDTNYQCEWGVYRKVSAKKIWNKIIDSAWSSAEPGIIFVDRVIDYSPDGIYDQYKPTNSNPCVTGDTLILTDRGYYPIVELVGKPIKIWNGRKFSEVIPKITGTAQKILIVKLSDGRMLKCTPYHTWFTYVGYANRGKQIVKTAFELKIGDKLEKYSFPVCDYGETVDTKVAYTQGFYSGDGNSNYNTIWLYNEKNNLTPYLSGKITGSPLTTHTGTIRQGFKIDFDVKPKSWVPVNEYSVKSRLDWLAGLIDSDGACCTEGGLQIVSVNGKFLSDVQLLLSTLGIDSKIVKAADAGYRSMPDGSGSSKEYFCNSSQRLLVSSFAMQYLLEMGLMTHRVDFSKFSPNRDASRFVKVISIDEQETLEDYVYCFTEPDEHKGIFNGILTGNCGEQNLEPYNSCRLIFANLFNLVKHPFTSEAEVDFELCYKVFYEMMVLGDDLVELEIEYVQRIIDKINNDPEPTDVKSLELRLWERIKERAIMSRRIGAGITGLGDFIAALGVKYDSEDALNIVDSLMYTKMQAELDCLIDLSITRGQFGGWSDEIEYPSGIPSNSFYKMLAELFPSQVSRMKKYGRRSVSWSTIAPVGSGSILTQTTSGCEPLFMPYHIRRRKINPSDVNSRIDFVDQLGDKWQEYAVLHTKFKDWLYLNHKSLSIPRLGIVSSELVDPSTWEISILENAFKYSPWFGSTANDIDWKRRVQMQSTLQKYITNAISSTINLPNNVSKESVNEIYFESWKTGAKGCTIYRDGCRTGVLIAASSTEVSFEQHDAPKRPKKLKCDVHVVSVKGIKYNVIVGMLNDKPYEVFCHLNDKSVTKGDGWIIKDGKGKYRYVSDRFDDVFVTSDMTDEQTAIARLISTSLRHGANIKFICEQLLKTDGDLTSFTKAIARVLKTYIPNGESIGLICSECSSQNIIFEEGCSKCLNCGSSKCS